MKTSICETRRNFDPIELTITIETSNELQMLWHLFNLCDIDISSILEESEDERIFKTPTEKVSTTTVWGALNDIAIERRLRS